MQVDKDLNAMFQKIFDNVYSTLKGDEGSPSKSLSGIFSNLWDLDKVNPIKFEVVRASKDAEMALNFREDGKDLLEKESYVKSLESFNQSIIYSPHPEGNERCTSNALATAYSLRSRILYELRHYSACLMDTHRAFQYGYPRMKKPELIELQMKCLIALNQNQDAVEVMRNYVKETHKTMVLSELYQIQPILKTWPDLFKTKEDPLSDVNWRFKHTTTEHTTQHFQSLPYKTELPILPLGETNPTIPSLRDAATLSYSVEKGRHLIATRDILPGEVLLIEESYVAAPKPMYHFSHCTMCLKRTYTPLPCPNCSCVVFCSDACSAKAQRLFHKVECPILPTLLTLKDQVGDVSIIILRFIIQVTLEKLRDIIPTYDIERKQRTPLELGFNDKNVYLSDEPRPIYHLKTNVKRMGFFEYSEVCKKAVVFVKVLLKSSFFGESVRNKDEIQRDIYLVGKVAFLLCLSFPCNRVKIREVFRNCDEELEIGVGIYSVYSLINHSCYPTTISYFDGSTMVVRASSRIPAGSEITCSYGPLFHTHSLVDRARILHDNYSFTCVCEACSGNWPLLSELPSKAPLRCPSCKATNLDAITKNCPKCKADMIHTWFPKLNAARVNSVLGKADSHIVQLRLRRQTKGKTFHCSVNEERSFKEMMEFLQVYSTAPNQPLVMAKAMLQIIYACRLSSFNEPPCKRSSTYREEKDYENSPKKSPKKKACLSTVP